MKKKQFSLIEIAISLAVAFLAITVLIAFFPTSFKRIKNAQERSYATNAAQQFTVYLKNTLTTFPTPARYRTTSATTWNTEYQNYLDKWDREVNTAADATGGLASSNSLPIAGHSAVVTYDATDYPIPSGFEGTLIVRHKTIPSVYLIRNVTSLNGVANVDNALEARIWKSPYVFNTAMSPGLAIREAIDSNDYQTDYDISARVNIELSWPITIPYDQRKYKTYKFLDLAK